MTACAIAVAIVSSVARSGMSTQLDVGHAHIWGTPARPISRISADSRWQAVASIRLSSPEGRSDRAGPFVVDQIRPGLFDGGEDPVTGTTPVTDGRRSGGFVGVPD